MAAQASAEHRVEVDAATLLHVLRWLLAGPVDRWSTSDCDLPGGTFNSVGVADLVEDCRAWTAADLTAWLQHLQEELRDGSEFDSALAANAARLMQGDVAPQDSFGCAAGASELRFRVAGALVRFSGRLQCSDPLVLQALQEAAHRVLQGAVLAGRFDELLRDKCRAWLYDFAYGLSHELNNPLASIATRAGVLANTSADPEVRRQCAALVEHAMRGRELLEDMMAVARPPTIRPGPVDLVEMIRSAVEQARQWVARAGAAVEVRLESADAVRGRGDRGALIEAVWCLIRNAVEAVGGDSGRVEVRLGKRSDTAVIEILDDGPGVGAAERERVWNPYYSGREAGRGLGLGLAKVQRIMAQHGGTADLENRPQGGCRAVLVLPIEAPSPEEERTPWK